MNIIEEAQKEISKLEKMIKGIDMFLSGAPEGCLKWQNKNGRTYYYHQYQSDTARGQDEKEQPQEAVNYFRRYIKKSDLKLAQILAQKNYYSSVKPLVQKQLKELKQFVNKYPKDNLEEMYETLSEERKRLVKPLQPSVKQIIKNWEAEVYGKNTKYSENLKFETDQGELVRSKSEIIIANLLYQNQNHILYKYERPLELNVEGRSKTIYPDFTILSKRIGKIIYWEHAGRMDDSYYVNDFVKKLNTYVMNGLLPGKDVILTYETQNNPLEIGVVKRMIKELI